MASFFITQKNEKGMNQDVKRTLWGAADKLRSSIDAAEYKHIVLGLIFLKYISDAFDERRQTLTAAFTDPASDLHLPDTGFHQKALEERDYYTMANVFWVPQQARWETLRALAKQPDTDPASMQRWTPLRLITRA